MIYSNCLICGNLRNLRFYNKLYESGICGCATTVIGTQTGRTWKDLEGLRDQGLSHAGLKDLEGRAGATRTYLTADFRRLRRFWLTRLLVVLTTDGGRNSIKNEIGKIFLSFQCFALSFGIFSTLFLRYSSLWLSRNAKNLLKTNSQIIVKSL